jgi:hypothetical protein
MGWGIPKRGFRGNKFGARKVKHDNHTFDSRLEFAVYSILKLREKAGELSDIQVKDTVYLTDARISYKADFAATDTKTGQRIWFEAKGLIGERWRVIRKLWSVYGPGHLEVWVGTHQKPRLDKVIIPHR